MGGSKTTVQNSGTTTTEIPAEIRNRGTTITNAAMNTYFDPAQKHQTFNYGDYAGVGESTTGQLNGEHEKARGAFDDAASSYKPYMDAATGVASGTQVDKPNYTNEKIAQFQNPWDQQVIDMGVRDIGMALDSQRLENQTAAAKAGAFGGARHGVVDAMAQKSAATTLSDFIGKQRQAGFNNAQNQYNTDFTQNVQAANQNQSLAQLFANLGTTGSDQAIKAGTAQQELGNIQTAQEQAQKDNAYEKGYLDKRDYPMDIYERLAAINAMQPVNRTSTTTGTSTQSQKGGWLGPALQAGASVAMMSDERAKDDIEDVDAEEVLGAFSRVKPKSYRYKDDVLDEYPDLTKPGPRLGFMAQDVERAFGTKAPEINGIKVVDMSEMIGNLVAAVHGLEARTRAFKRART
jgi:hypothetical protein